MTHGSCSLLECGQADEVDLEYTMDDYEGPRARWCPGCGDFGVLTSTRRLLEAHQLKPERTVFVSGIGCSSRFPHYLTTYGFHGIHGRALPIATGVKLSRPDLDVFVVMGDGDCCSIGAGHWVHAIRYNVDMVVLLLDNNVYGLTKNQTSPTSPQGLPTNTQPRGSYLPPLNPISVTLGVSNASFVAQTADWMPSHMYATLQAAYQHNGFSFVRILQRCPKWTPGVFQAAVMNPDNVEILTHENGINAEDLGDYKTRVAHDPLDLDAARHLADESTGKVRIGLFYANEALPRYEETRHLPVYTAEEKIEKLNLELDRHAV